MSDPVPFPNRAGVPVALGKVLLSGLEKNPVHRPASAAEFGDALREVERGLGLIPTEQVYTSPTVALPAAAPVPPSDSPATIHPDALPAVERTAARRRGLPPGPAEPSPGTAPTGHGGREAAVEAEPSRPSEPAPLPTASSAEGTIVRRRHGFEGRSPDHAEARPGRSGARTALTVLTVALVLAAVAAAGFFVLRPDDESSSTGPTSTTAPASSEPSTSTTSPAPAPPTNRVENLQVARTIDGTQAILSWKNTNAENTQYYVLLDPALPGEKALPASGPDQAAVSDLKPDTRYCFRIYSFPGNDPENDPVFSQAVCPPR
jgi:hypothetical protein